MANLHPLLKYFSDEHGQILCELKERHARRDWPGFFKYGRDIVLNGHEKCEELFLFSAIGLKAEIRSGGPLCMLYYGLRLESPPLETAAARCGQPRIDPHQHLDEIRRPFYQSGSPVCIPIEDHMALEQVLNRADRGGTDDELANFADYYLRLITTHFEKEDQCLFPMCQDVLSVSEMDEWAAKRALWKRG